MAIMSVATVSAMGTVSAVANVHHLGRPVVAVDVLRRECVAVTVDTGHHSEKGKGHHLQKVWPWVKLFTRE